jgi:hypothetical protein
MSLSNHSNSPNLTGASALPVPATNQQSHEPTSSHQPPSARELRRFLERRRAQELGYEMPLNTDRDGLNKADTRHLEKPESK